MFKVNGQKWKIKAVSASDTHLMRSDGSITVGVADNNDKTVYISMYLHGAFLDKVLCHELTHVFCFEYDINIPIETEELIADFLSLYGRDIIYLADNIINNYIRRVA